MQVLAGPHRGQTGMVLRAKDGVCVILSDATKEELKVFDRDVSDAAAVQSMGVDLLGGQYQLHDFVQLDEKTVGIVLEVKSSTAALVLTNQGTTDQPDIRTCKVGGLGLGTELVAMFRQLWARMWREYVTGYLSVKGCGI